MIDKNCIKQSCFKKNVIMQFKFQIKDCDESVEIKK